jgi:hypothetical protein
MDLASAIESMPLHPGWVRNAFQYPNAPGTIQDAAEKNDYIASTFVRRALIARWIIFRTFIQVAKEQHPTLSESIKRDWLLFQILPNVLVGSNDPFEAIAPYFVGLDDMEVYHLLGQVEDPTFIGPSFDITCDQFGYVLDEAQETDKYMGCFANESFTIPCPVLRPIIRTMAAHKQDIKVIVSGTGFSFELFKATTRSGVGKTKVEWSVVHDTGDFTNREVQISTFASIFPRLTARDHPSTSAICLVVRPVSYLNPTIPWSAYSA